MASSPITTIEEAVRQLQALSNDAFLQQQCEAKLASEAKEWLGCLFGSASVRMAQLSSQDWVPKLLEFLLNVSCVSDRGLRLGSEPIQRQMFLVLQSLPLGFYSCGSFPPTLYVSATCDPRGIRITRDLPYFNDRAAKQAEELRDRFFGTTSNTKESIIEAATQWLIAYVEESGNSCAHFLRLGLYSKQSPLELSYPRAPLTPSESESALPLPLVLVLVGTPRATMKWTPSRVAGESARTQPYLKRRLEKQQQPPVPVRSRTLLGSV